MNRKINEKEKKATNKSNVVLWFPNTAVIAVHNGKI